MFPCELRKLKHARLIPREHVGDVELDETTSVISVPVELTIGVRVDVTKTSGKKHLQRLS